MADKPGSEIQKRTRRSAGADPVKPEGPGSPEAGTGEVRLDPPAGAGEGTATTSQPPIPGILPPAAVGSVKPPVNPVRSAAQKNRVDRKKDDAPANRLKLAQETSDTLIAVAETLAVTFAGPEAALQDPERLLISQSLPKVLEKATPAVIEQVEAITYPGMLLVGVGAYAFRVIRLASAQAKVKRETQPAKIVQPPQAGPHDNGASQPAPQILTVPNADNLAAPDRRDFINPRL